MRFLLIKNAFCTKQKTIALSDSLLLLIFVAYPTSINRMFNDCLTIARVATEITCFP